VKAAMVTIFSCLTFKPSFFMVCALEMAAMLNIEIKMAAKITVSFWFMTSPTLFAAGAERREI
jgi:hypothetical protein